MNALLNQQRLRRDRSVKKKIEKFFVVSSRVLRVSRARVFRVLLNCACSCISLARLSVVEIRDYSQSNKEIAFVTRDGYLEEELLTELIVPLLLNHTIYVDTNFLIFSSSLLLLLSTMASCLETFETEVIYLCLFTLL